MACHHLTQPSLGFSLSIAASLTIPASCYPRFLPVPQSTRLLLIVQWPFPMLRSGPDPSIWPAKILPQIGKDPSVWKPKPRSDFLDVSSHLTTISSFVLLNCQLQQHSFTLILLLVSWKCLSLDPGLWLRSLLSKFLATVSGGSASLYPQHFDSFASCSACTPCTPYYASFWFAYLFCFCSSTRIFHQGRGFYFFCFIHYCIPQWPEQSMQHMVN